MADICAVQNKKPHLTKEERFPRCYKDVSKVLKIVKSCKGNLKTVLYNSKLRGAYLKKVQGLASNILKNYRTVAKVIERIDLLKKEPLLQLECVEVMVYELILGTGTLVGHSKPIEAMKKYHQDILNAFQSVESESTSDSDPRSLPRYARVNTLVTTPHQVSEELHRLGYEEVHYGDSLSQEQYLELIRGLRSPQFLVDYHFPDLLVFPAGENLCRLKMYQKGKILLQDKSSYIPVKALDPEPGSAVLDACAAPGMKTIHIAAMMQNQGVLLAYEKDAERFATLQKMIQQYNIQTCETFNQDFRSTDPTDDRHSKVRYILLDPSCSGSGMVNRMDSATDRPDSKSESRLQKLAGFQIVLLKHALKFPNVQRVVYSTCSIHEEENEFVVHEALGAFRDRFGLVPVLPEWPTRGSGKYEFGELCLRSYPEENATNGFFVAAFERLDDSGGSLSEKRTKNGKHRSEVEVKEPDVTDDVPNSNHGDDSIREGTRKSHKRKKHETAEHIEGGQSYLEPGAPDCEEEEFRESKRNKKKHRSENELNLMDDLSNSNYGENGIGDDHHRSRKKKKHEKAELESEELQNNLEPGARDCKDEEFPKSKRNKKKHQSEDRLDEDELNSTDGLSNFEDNGIGDDRHESRKRKRHEKAELEKENLQNILEPGASDCKAEEFSKSKRNKKKHRSEIKVDENEYSCTSEMEGVQNQDDGIDDNCFENQKRKKRKKNRRESEGENFELSNCDGEETSLVVKKEKRVTERSDIDEKGNVGKNSICSELGEMCGSGVEDLLLHKKKKKKHKTKHEGKESWTEPADSETSTLGRIQDSDLIERRQNDEQCRFDDESMMCTVGDSKKKKKRKKHEAETDESIVYQENRSGDGEAEGIQSFKKHKKHKKKERRSHSPKPDE